MSLDEATTEISVNLVPLRQVKDVRQLLGNEHCKKALAAVASRNMSPERLMKLIAKSITVTSKLADCEPMSMYRALMNCVEYNLEPNSPSGHCFIIPYKNTRAGTYVATWIPGYKGFLALAHRHPLVKGVHADIVYDDDDQWSYAYGSDQHLRHRPGPRKGNVIGAYCYAKLDGGGEVFRFMTAAEIIAIRDKSSGWRDAVSYGKTQQSAWTLYEPAMFRKTAVRGLANGGELPMQAEFIDALGADHEDSPVDLSGLIAGSIEGSATEEEDKVVEEEGKPADKKPAAEPDAAAAAAEAKAKAQAAKDAPTKAKPKAEPKAEAKPDPKPEAEAQGGLPLGDGLTGADRPIIDEISNAMIDLPSGRAREVLDMYGDRLPHLSPAGTKALDRIISDREAEPEPEQAEG